MNIHKRIVVLLFVVLANSWLYGQVIRPRTPFILHLDFARFRNDTGSTYLEFYYSFYAGSMTFAERDSAFRGSLFLNTVIQKTSSGDTVVSRREVLHLVLGDTTAQGLRSAFVKQNGFALPSGSYRLSVSASDSMRPAGRDSLSPTVALPSYAKNTTGSDLELCSEVKNASAVPTMFTKNSLDVMVNPTLVFGAMSYPVMFWYIELYSLDTAVTYQLTTQVVDGTDGTVQRSNVRLRKFTVRNSADVGHFTVSSFKSGRYLLRFALSDTMNHAIFQTEKKFYLDNPQIKQPAVAASTNVMMELAGLSSGELADEFHKAQYLATNQEIKTFESIGSTEGRAEFLAKFWSEVETGRGMNKPTDRYEYLRRIDVANQRYHSFRKEGWLTDRGRVFVVYGEPDEIERYPSSDNSKPYEIWHYYQIENSVIFVFIDRSGFGDYTLVNSTKRGEIEDDNWQEYLK
ncbi:MAG TPA: GWxTD domain-containing protein [Bacteroidota bacterium]|nr:GWxTD domain-containing protein [Bacteroidota bacterium]